MSGPGRAYACGCCTPPRAIYYRAGRPDTVHHEHDHSPAEAREAKDDAPMMSTPMKHLGGPVAWERAS